MVFPVHKTWPLVFTFYCRFSSTWGQKFRFLYRVQEGTFRPWSFFFSRITVMSLAFWKIIFLEAKLNGQIKLGKALCELKKKKLTADSWLILMLRAVTASLIHNTSAASWSAGKLTLSLLGENLCTAATTRSGVATSLAYRDIKASITDRWALWKLKHKNIMKHITIFLRLRAAERSWSRSQYFSKRELEPEILSTAPQPYQV